MDITTENFEDTFPLLLEKVDAAIHGKLRYNVNIQNVNYSSQNMVILRTTFESRARSLFHARQGQSEILNDQLQKIAEEEASKQIDIDVVAPLKQNTWHQQIKGESVIYGTFTEILKHFVGPVSRISANQKEQSFDKKLPNLSPDFKDQMWQIAEEMMLEFLKASSTLHGVKGILGWRLDGLRTLLDTKENSEFKKQAAYIILARRDLLEANEEVQNVLPIETNKVLEVILGFSPAEIRTLEADLDTWKNSPSVPEL